MRSNTNIWGIALIKFLLIAFRCIFLFYSIGLILYFLVTTISFATRSETIQPSLPVMFRLAEKGNLKPSMETKVADVNLYYANGFITTEYLPKSIGIFSTFVFIFISICVLGIIKLICQILEAAKTGAFLVVQNALRMRYMAILFILIFFIDKLNLFVSSSYFSDKLDFAGVSFISSHYYGLSRWEYIFFYLFLLVVAEAFRIGAQLKHENDLTI